MENNNKGIINSYSDTLNSIGRIAQRILFDVELSEKGIASNTKEIQKFIPRLELEKFEGLGGFYGHTHHKSQYIMCRIVEILEPLDTTARVAYLRKLVLERLYAFPYPVIEWTVNTPTNKHLQSQDILDLCQSIIFCCNEYTQKLIREAGAFDITPNIIFAYRNQMGITSNLYTGLVSYNPLSDKKDIQSKPIPQFNTGQTHMQLETLYQQLINSGYIASDTDKDSFVWAFGGNQHPVNFKPVKWINPVKSNPKNISKRSLIDLLYTLGVTNRGILSDNRTYKALFSLNETPLTMSSKNISDAEKDQWKSKEYHAEIIEIISKL